MSKKYPSDPEDVQLVVAEETAEPQLEKYTIAALAKRNGQTRQVREDLGDSPYTPEHMAASVLNAWARHDYFVGGEVKLTDAEYMKCIAAAAQGNAVPELDLHSKTPALEPAPDRSAMWGN